MKTANEIERDFHAAISGSDLAKAVNGGVYREGCRPKDSRLEDITVAFIAGLDTQVQEGTVIANVFVCDVPYDGRMVKDFGRVGELETLANHLNDAFRGSDYYVYKEGTPHTVNVDELSQHCIVIRLRYKLLTD